ncbi:hypothetical protein [Streptomyces sp. E-08]|uniref:hypothetical protein n=1 Tax=Streptomyces sp. E-08 TaxID=3404047 RepID=UPI003CF035C7
MTLDDRTGSSLERISPSTDAWKTEVVRTVRTKKVPRNHVKAEANSAEVTDQRVGDAVFGYLFG